MKNFTGYLKLKLGDSYVLLAGGSHRSLNDFILPLNTSPSSTITTGLGAWTPITGRYVFRLNWKDSSTGSDTADLSIYLDGNLTANMCIDGYFNTLSGYKIIGSDNNSVLLAGGGTKAISDFKIGNYVSKTGDTMTAMLRIEKWPGLEIVNNSNTNGETGLRVRSTDSNGTDNIKAYFGWLSSLGSYQYNAACGKYLGIKDDGTPHLSGSTLLYAGNYTSYVYSKSTSDGRYLRKDTSDSTAYLYEFTKTNDHAIKVGTIRGRAVGDRTGEYIHLYERVHIGSPNGWGSNEAPSYGLSTYGGTWLATSTGSVGIGTTSPETKLDLHGILQIYQRGNDNTAFKNLLLLKLLNSTETSGDTFGSSYPSFGIGFRRYWTSGSSPYGETTCAGIYSFVTASWRGGLVFRTKWNETLGGTHDVSALILHPSGAATFNSGITVSGSQTLYGMTSTCNYSNSASYSYAAMQIREYNFGGSLSDTWGNAPRLAWHWSGRVLALIGLASNNHLYISEDNFSNAYRIVMETGTWGINITGSAGSAGSATSSTYSSYPAGFTSRGSSDWSGVPGTFATDWSVNGADIMFKYNGSYLNVITDGYFYLGIDIYGSSKRVLDEYDISHTTWGTASVANSVAWGNVSGKPSSYTPASHTHDISAITWAPSSNLRADATANSLEWSIDIYRNGYSGCYWHVWDSSLSTMLKVEPDTGLVSAPYGFYSSGQPGYTVSHSGWSYSRYYSGSSFWDIGTNQSAGGWGSNGGFGIRQDGADNNGIYVKRNTSSYGKLCVGTPSGECSIGYYVGGSAKWTVGCSDGTNYGWYQGSSGGWKMTLDTSGNLKATNFYTTSDRNKKKNITILSEHIRKFTLKENNKDMYGVIALEVPEMFRDGNEGNMTVNYSSVLSYYIGLLENKVSELSNTVKELAEKLSMLERRLILSR